MEEMCEQMMMGHDSMEMNGMQHDVGHKDMMHEKDASNSSDCVMTIDCDCTTENDFVATIAPNVVLKTNISPVLASIDEISATVQNFSSANFNLSILNYYSPPPLFLANESFLI